MTKLLLKLFVRNSENRNDSTVRESVGKMSGIVGIVLNSLLAAAKILVGALFGIISVLADGLNNLTDCGSNVVSFISFKLAGKPADKEHPYGHARMEYIASMGVAFIVLILAFELGAESVTKIIELIRGEDQAAALSLWTLIALGVSVLVKLWMFFFNRKLAKLYNSELLKATATDSISDVCATSGVLVSVIITHFTGFNTDGIMGLIVAVIITIAGIKILSQTLSNLLGEAPDSQFIKQIDARIRSYDGVLGVHDLNVHNYGPNKYYASVHIEVDSDVPIMKSHDMVDLIERDFAQNTDVVLVVHMDPIVIGDPESDKFKEQIEQIVHDLDQRFEIHDFRMVKGVTHTNLIFDIAVCYDTKLTSPQICEHIQSEVNKLYDNVYVVCTVEQQIK